MCCTWFIGKAFTQIRDLTVDLFQSIQKLLNTFSFDPTKIGELNSESFHKLFLAPKVDLSLYPIAYVTENSNAWGLFLFRDLVRGFCPKISQKMQFSHVYRAQTGMCLNTNNNRLVPCAMMTFAQKLLIFVSICGARMSKHFWNFWFLSPTSIRTKNTVFFKAIRCFI